MVGLSLFRLEETQKIHLFSRMEHTTKPDMILRILKRERFLRSLTAKYPHAQGIPGSQDVEVYQWSKRTWETNVAELKRLLAAASAVMKK
jgi:hypothetical protein